MVVEPFKRGHKVEALWTNLYVKNVPLDWDDARFKVRKRVGGRGGGREGGLESGGIAKALCTKLYVKNVWTGTMSASR